MTAIAHAELPFSAISKISTPHYGTSLIGLPAAVLLAGLVLLGVRGCRLGVEPEPVPAMMGAVGDASLSPGRDSGEDARGDLPGAILVVGLGVAP
jgi:hypothetical protein